MSKPPGYETAWIRDDAALRAKAKNAPPRIKRLIDRDRQRRGLPPLWDAVELRSRIRPTGLVAVIGCASPGLSVPVAAALDGELVPERVEPAAYAASVQAAKLGKATVELVDGHWPGAAVLATTADGSLVLHNDSTTGLVLRANLHVREHAEFLADVYAGLVGLSISFRPRRMAIEREHGRRVRVVREIELVDVAALREHRNQGQPAYRHARLYAALADDPAAVRRARERAICHALAAVYKPRGR
jgi:hypothetical protein